jgi:hypothetical protein
MAGAVAFKGMKPSRSAAVIKQVRFSTGISTGGPRSSFTNLHI